MLKARWLVAVALLAAQGLALAHATGKLEIRDAWVRSAPPNATMLAGYATLHNVGDVELTISAVTADGFGDASLHESLLVGDVSRMQPLGDLTIAPGGSVSFVPGGKHIMLAEPSTPPRVGDRVTIRFRLAAGGEQPADFLIRDAAPGDETAAPVTHIH